MFEFEFAFTPRKRISQTKTFDQLRLRESLAEVQEQV
jgi:hypothetical protein